MFIIELYKNAGSGEIAHQLRALAALRKTWIQFPLPKWLFTTLQSLHSGLLYLALEMQEVHR